MRKYPCYLQEEKNDCGPACVKSILLYYHGDYDYQKLKEELCLDRDGTSAYHIIQFLNRHGFSSEGKKYLWKDWIGGEFLLPAIVLVKNELYQNHYMVLYRYDKKKEKVLVGDPKEGVKTLTLRQFHQIFTGIMIELVPMGMIVCERSSSFKNLLYAFLKEHKRTVLLFIPLLIFFLGFQLCTSFTTKYFVNGIVDQKKNTYFYILFFLFFLFHLFRELYSYFLKRLFSYLQLELQLLLDRSLYQTILSRSDQRFQHCLSSFFLEKREEVYLWISLFLQCVQFFFLDFLFAFCFFLCLCFLDREYFFFLFPFFLFTYFYYTWVRKKQKKREEACRKEALEGETLFLESMENRSFLATTDLVSIFTQKYERRLEKMSLSFHTYFQAQHRIDLFYQFCFLFLYLYLLLYQSLMTLEKNVSLGNFILFLTMFQFLFPVFKQLPMISDAFGKLQFYYERIKPFFEEPKSKSLFQEFTFQTLLLQQFTYEYHQKKLLFSDVSLCISASDKILLTGASGTGKSTFLKCLSGRLEINKGEIYLNQLDLCDYQKEGLYAKMILLTQEETLFQGTLFDNIVLDRSVSKEKLVEVIRCCQLEEVIQRHPQGLRQMLTNHGSQLSGGERQRVILARFLLQPFDVFMIDEGFSEMDISLERQILKNLFYTYFQKTFIVISHRMDNRDLFGRHFSVRDRKLIED